MIQSSIVLCDFHSNADLKNWQVVDDVVMGGVSSGNFKLDVKGNAVFSGRVSTENNGGFSSVRGSLAKASVSNNQKIILFLKGDGKKYQFRVKARRGDYYSYVLYFETSGDWEQIEIPLSKMYPAFRGRRLDKPNFDQSQIEEIAFLIGNKVGEEFSLSIDKIILQ
ncbi:CIA30 family protein [Namhaeicola litoreus]|uniref:CIA30 family protein n=1 Tax=Namhaeicola litoreus TaxID=1052145 RepID=A0ABW3Y0J3_9FLAO